jgi:ABC-type phosphate transport system substrate-binding protein
MKLLFIILLTLTTTNLCADGIIIANTSSAMASLSQNDVKKIFLGQKTYWENGQKIIIVIQKKGEVHKQFLKKYLNKSTLNFRNFWRKKIFSGNSSLPKTLNEDEDIVEYIANNSGAIGYIHKKNASNNTKLLTIQIN